MIVIDCYVCISSILLSWSSNNGWPFWYPTASLQKCTLDHNFTTTCPNVKMTVITLKPFATAVIPDFSDEKKLKEWKKNNFANIQAWV